MPKLPGHRVILAAAFLASILCAAGRRAAAQPCTAHFGGFVPLGPVGSTVLGAWDFDRDGRPDVLVRDGDSVSVLRGGGGGSFAAPEAVFVGSVVVGDFDGDGILDVVGVQRRVPTPLVSFLKGDGRGGFHETPSFRASAYLSSPVAGDFDGDGKLDLAGLAAGPYVWWYRGDGRGGFGEPSAFLALPLNAFGGVGGLDTLDADVDGHTDLLLSASLFKSTLLETWVLQPSGFFAEAAFGPDAGGFECGFDVAKGDLDGDGHEDLVSVNDHRAGCFDGLQTYLARPGGGVRLEQEGRALQAPVLADFDGDGRVDLAALEEVVDYRGRPYPSSTHWLSVQPGDGTGPFGGSVVFAMPVVAYLPDTTLVAADFDGDGRTDLILSGAYNSAPLLIWNTCHEIRRPALPGPRLPPRPRPAR